MTISKALQIFISKGGKIKKLKPQKSPTKSGKWLDQEADLRARTKFDSIFDSTEDNVYQGVKILATKHAAAQTLASRTAIKKWNRSLPKAIKKQRSTIASFAKSYKGKVSLSGIKKAKIKSFVKTLDKKDIQFERIRSKTEQLFTGSKGRDPLKTFSKKVKTKFVSKEQKKNWGF